MEVIAIIVFVVVIGLIISEKVNSAAAALAGAMALVVTGVMSAHRALSYHRFQYYRSASGHDGARCHNKAVRVIRVCRN